MSKICIADFSGKRWKRVQGMLKHEAYHTVLMELPKAFRKKKKYVKRHKRKHDVSIITVEGSE